MLFRSKKIYGIETALYTFEYELIEHIIIAYYSILVNWSNLIYKYAIFLFYQFLFGSSEILSVVVLKGEIKYPLSFALRKEVR